MRTSPSLLTSDNPTRLAWRALSLLTWFSIAVGVVLPGAIVMPGPHHRLAMVCPFLLFAIPSMWIIRWRSLGFLLGVLLLWGCLHAAALNDWQPDYVDDFLPAVTLIFGWIPAIVVLVPVWLVVGLLLAIASARRIPTQSLDETGRLLIPPTMGNASAWELLVVFPGVVVSLALLVYSSTQRTAHAQEASLRQIGRAGGQLHFDPSRFRGPLVGLRVFGGAFGDAQMALLAPFEQLEELDLDNSGVTDAGLRRLQGFAHLRKLTLRHTAITGAGLIHLRGHPSLSLLELLGSPVTPSDVDDFRRACPHVTVVYEPGPAGAPLR
jgi:hypothetical protein